MPVTSSAPAYLDWAATTPLLPAARAEMARGFDIWANPSSPHGPGRAARAALEDARRRVKAALDWDGDVIFTGGASEAIAIALSGPVAARLAVSPVEHDAVLRRAGDARRLAVDAAGLVDPASIPADATLVAIQAVNSETGVIQPLDLLVDRARSLGARLFVDAAQSAGKIALPDADLIALSAHKLGGPPGVGALLVRDLALLNPVGGQEQGYRAGTENLPAILGFAAALEASRGWLGEAGRLRAMLDEGARGSGGEVVAEQAPRLPTIASYRLPGMTAAAILIQADMAGIALSAGSACSSGSLKPSATLSAMGWGETAAREVVRVSIGRDTSEAEIRRFLDFWAALAQRRAA